MKLCCCSTFSPLLGDFFLFFYFYVTYFQSIRQCTWIYSIHCAHTMHYHHINHLETLMMEGSVRTCKPKISISMLIVAHLFSVLLLFLHFCFPLAACLSFLHCCLSSMLKMLFFAVSYLFSKTASSRQKSRKSDHVT